MFLFCKKISIKTFLKKSPVIEFLYNKNFIKKIFHKKETLKRLFVIKFLFLLLKLIRIDLF